MVSNAKPSLYSYQPETKPPEKEKIEKIETAVLSTTAKTTARAKTKEKEKDKPDAMDTVSLSNDFMQLLMSKQDEKSPTETVDESTKDDAIQTDEAEQPKKKDEPSSERLSNMSRVVPAQLSSISFPPESRFVPVRPLPHSAPAPASKTNKNKRTIAASAASTFLASALISQSNFAGGGIFVLLDNDSSKEAEYFEMTSAQAVEEPLVDAAAQATAGTQSSISVDRSAPIAPMRRSIL